MRDKNERMTMRENDEFIALDTDASGGCGYDASVIVAHDVELGASTPRRSGMKQMSGAVWIPGTMVHTS